MYAYVEYMGITATFSSFYFLNILFSPFTDLQLLADVLNKNNGFQVAVLFYLEFGKQFVNIFKINIGLYKNSFLSSYELQLYTICADLICITEIPIV